MPNPGKPAEVKRLLGAKGYGANAPKPTIVIAAADGIPEPSRALDVAGRALWDRIWGAGQIWLSPNTDTELLLMTCELLDERELLKIYVANDFERWRERAALREVEKGIVRNLSLLGFTPSDRMKLGIAEVKKISKLEQLKAKHG